MISRFEFRRQLMMPDQNQHRSRSLIRALVGMVCVALFSLDASAQTRFLTHDTLPDYSKYNHVEECIGALRRTADSLRRSNPLFLDTVPAKQGMGLAPSSPQAVKIASICAEPFNADSVELDGLSPTYNDWIELFLVANRDDAAAVVARRQTAIARKSDSVEVLELALIEMIKTYGNVRPIRWGKILEIGLQYDSIASDSVKRYIAYHLQFGLADSVSDTATQTKMARQMLAITEPSGPDKVVKDNSFKEGRYMALTYLTHLERMDSLRHGSAAYIAMSRKNWSTAGGGAESAIPGMVGEPALPIEAEFWFASKDAPMTSASDHLRPAPGKLSLIIFMRQGCNERGISRFYGGKDRATFVTECRGTYSSLHRLSQRFPSLEITIVGRTSGYTSTGPLEPADEAAVLRKWWLDYYKLPAALAVANTPYFRLEGFDRRRIDRTVNNDVNYLFGKEGRQEIGNKMAFLIDSNGSVIHSESLSLRGERTFAELLDMMVQQPK